jgi:precorrin-6B methylase 2
MNVRMLSIVVLGTSLVAATAVDPGLVASAADAVPQPASLAAPSATVAPGVDAARYETRRVHDPEGTGRFYMGREIAQVMGFAGAAWLERPERVQEERPDDVIAALAPRPGERIVDLGAGSGYFALRLAPRVGPEGRVLAVDVSADMLRLVRRRAEQAGLKNVELVLATEQDPGLAPASVDAVLMVDVYHELYWPYEVMTRVREALKPGGRLVLVEYRGEDPRVPIKATHKMTEGQAKRELAAAGFRYVKTVRTLPLQHVLVFER